MAKDRAKDKKAKEKRSGENGVRKSKKGKRDKEVTGNVVGAILASVDDEGTGAIVNSVAGIQDSADVSDVESARPTVSVAVDTANNLVPFAMPLADNKTTKRIFKTVKKASKHKALKRGVKEVVKAVRKSLTDRPASSLIEDPSAVVIIAADISPMDIISHIPVLCEDHNVPYIFVASRAELGAAGNTKRPTSVVMVCKDCGSKKGAADEPEAKYKAAYDGVVKAVTKLSKEVRR